MYWNMENFSALGELTKAQRVKVERGWSRAVDCPRCSTWSVVRLDPDGTIMYGFTTDWDSDPHPRLERSITLKPGGAAKERRYNDPPIYHRKEQMVPRSHPMWEHFKRLSDQEDVIPA